MPSRTKRTQRVVLLLEVRLALPREGLTPPILCQLVLAHSVLGVICWTLGPSILAYWVGANA
jgi:hypothetical protein